MAKIEFEIDDEIAGKLGEFSSSTGIPVETLCSLFVRKVAFEQRIPFEVSVKRKSFLGESFRKTDPFPRPSIVGRQRLRVCPFFA